MKLKNIAIPIIFTWISVNFSAQEINYNFQLNSHELEWLSNRIYSNECNSNFNCLTYWNAGEEFPSLGIGHFIWFHSEQEPGFEETFPQLIEFMRIRNAPIPKWLTEESNLKFNEKTYTNIVTISSSYGYSICQRDERVS